MPDAEGNPMRRDCDACSLDGLPDAAVHVVLANAVFIHCEVGVIGSLPAGTQVHVQAATVAGLGNALIAVAC
jgi:hypothetical protein